MCNRRWRDVSLECSPHILTQKGQSKPNLTEHLGVSFWVTFSRICCFHCLSIFLVPTTVIFDSPCLLRLETVLSCGTLLKKMKVCVSHVLSHVLEKNKTKQNKGGNVEMPNFGDTVLFSYCVILFSAVCIVSA